MILHADKESAVNVADLPEVISSATEGPAVLYRKGREDGIYRGVPFLLASVAAISLFLKWMPVCSCSGCPCRVVILVSFP